MRTNDDTKSTQLNLKDMNKMVSPPQIEEESALEILQKYCHNPESSNNCLNYDATLSQQRDLQTKNLKILDPLGTKSSQNHVFVTEKYGKNSIHQFDKYLE